MTVLSRVARFHRENRILLADLLLICALVAMGFWVRTLAEQGDEAHQALCAQRLQQQRLLKETEDYLTMTIPERIAKFGAGNAHISPAVIRVQIVNYEQTLRSYERLRC